MLDFDELKRMAEEDPEAIERYRKQVIEDYISSLPEERQQRARQLQFKIDASTVNIKNQQVKADRIFCMMMESFNELNDVFQNGAPSKEGPRKTSEVADFAKIRQEKLDKSTENE